MANQETEAAKALLRKRAHAKREAILPAARAEASQAAAQHFFDGISLRPGEIVAAYWPIRDELDCQPIMIKLMDAMQPVCLPLVLGPDEPLDLRLWEEGAPLYPSGFGTLAPSELAPLVEPDIVLMPLLGFDKRGTRLGYGGGYYDRTLAVMRKTPRLIGLAFDCQEIDEIPREFHDVPLDAVVTEGGVRYFSQEVGSQ
jgi:5-formyltetrahydrofolate cyclo-ligase